MSADTTPCQLDDEIRFREYSACEKKSLRPALFAARESFRGALARGWLQLAVDRSGEPQIIASHFVGLIPFRCPAVECGNNACPANGQHLILIRPKGDRGEDLGGLLRFLDLALLYPPEETEQAFTGQRGDEQYVVLARHYAEVLRELCRRDFRRYYRSEEGELAGRIRGRLHVAGHLRNSLRGRGHLAPCRWEEFTADNWDNRILLGAVRALERAARDVGSQASAAKVRAQFRPIEPWFGEVEEVQIGPADLHKARLGRMSVHYRRALEWARLVLQGMNRPTNGRAARGLVVDANRAFEKLAEVTAQSAAYLLGGGLEAKAHHEAPFPTLLEGGIDRQPDLTFQRGNRVEAVGDAKYKDVIELAQRAQVELDNPSGYAASINAADWNQLYVYLRLAGAAKGFFVVPYWNASDAPAQLLDPPAFARSPLDGNAPTEVKVLGLNLLCSVGVVRRDGARLLAQWLRKSAVAV